MGIAHDAKSAVGHALGNVHAGDDKLAWRKLCGERSPTLDVRSDAFAAGDRLPLSSTADGAETPPSLRWSEPPPQTRSIVVLVEDPDAPLPDPYVHWMVYGIPKTANALTHPSASGAKEGKNSRLKTGFAGAAPPPGHGVHHYHFQVFALDTALNNLEAGAGRDALLGGMKGHVVAFGDLVGTYERT